MASNEQQPKNKRTRSGLFLSLLFIIFLILGSGGVFWYNKNSMDQIHLYIQHLQDSEETMRIELNNITETQSSQLNSFRQQSTSIEQVEKLLFEQQKNSADILSKFQNMQGTINQGSDYWLLTQIEYLLRTGIAQLENGGDLASVKLTLEQTQVMVEESLSSNDSINRLIALSITGINDAIKNNPTSLILTALDKVKLLLKPLPLITEDKTPIEQRSLLSYLSTEEIKSLWKGLTNSLNTLVVVKSKNQFDIRRLKSEEQRVINSLMVLNIDLIKLSVKQRQDENYQQALDGLIAKLNEYYKSELENNPEMIEELQSLKQIVLRPNNETINQAIEEIQRLRKA